MECRRGCSHALRTIRRHRQTHRLIRDASNARRPHIGGVLLQLLQRCLVCRSWRKQFLHTDHPLNSAYTHRPHRNIIFGGQRRRSSRSGVRRRRVATCKETTRNHCRNRKSAHASNLARSRQMSKWRDHTAGVGRMVGAIDRPVVSCQKGSSRPAPHHSPRRHQRRRVDGMARLSRPRSGGPLCGRQDQAP